MKRTAMTFSLIFVAFLLVGFAYVMQGLDALGGMVMIASGIGANLSLLLYDTPRLMSKGIFGKYKWQDDVIILSTVIALGISVMLIIC